MHCSELGGLPLKIHQFELSNHSHERVTFSRMKGRKQIRKVVSYALKKTSLDSRSLKASAK